MVALSLPAVAIYPRKVDSFKNSAIEKQAIHRDLFVEGHSISLANVGRVTVGGWAKESHPKGCSDLSSEPLVEGYNLGKCYPSETGTASWSYEWCGWDQTKSVLYVNQLYYSGTNTCSGSPLSNTTTAYTGLKDGCKDKRKHQCGATVSYSNYNSPQHSETYNSDSCNEDEVAWDVLTYSSCTGNGACERSDGTMYSTRGICDDPDNDNVCFHIDTIIDYKGKEYTFQELLDGNEPECVIPHTPKSQGLIINTNCNNTLRVTETHLVVTTKGHQLAYTLKAGDDVFIDYDNSPCSIASVQKEDRIQQYFGLNCVYSEVLASGIRVSTFGDFHLLPSWYMTYVGGLIGSSLASTVGDFVSGRIINLI